MYVCISHPEQVVKPNCLQMEDFQVFRMKLVSKTG